MMEGGRSVSAEGRSPPLTKPNSKLNTLRKRRGISEEIKRLRARYRRQA